MLGDLNAGNVGRLRSELTPDFSWSRRFHIPDVDMARPAKEVHEDARLGPTEARYVVGFTRRQRRSVRPRISEDAERSAHTHAEAVSPAPPLAQIQRAAADA